MKKHILLFAILLLSSMLFAQTDHSVELQPLLEEAAKVYNLSDRQLSQMQYIQTRKLNAIQQIEQFKTTDPSAFQKKLRAIYSGTRQSVNMLLTDSQRVYFKKRMQALRQQKAQIAKKLRQQNAGPMEIEAALMQLEATTY